MISAEHPFDFLFPRPRSKLQRDQDRDVSELIALGKPNPRSSSEAQYDQRLFNQSKVGMILRFLVPLFQRSHLGFFAVKINVAESFSSRSNWILVFLFSLFLFRVWTVALLVVKMRRTTCMTSLSAVAEIWPPTSTGPARI